MSETIVFFGSGPVAAKALSLLTKNFTIEAIVSKPKPVGHHGDFPVLSLANKLNLKTFTVSNKQELSELFKNKPVKGRLGVVIDFGIIINQDVIDYFAFGIVNSHFSLLPEWRGADPITFSILSGQNKTGVSLMLIDETLDTGKLIAQKSLTILPSDTTPSLTESLIGISDSLLANYLPKYIDGTVKLREQPHSSRATYSRKLTKEDGVIDWHKPAEQIEREIRAYLDWPKSRTILGDKEVIIIKTHLVDKSGQSGQFHTENKQLIAYTGSQALAIDRLKPAGKNEMSGEAFIRGYLRS